MANLKSGTLIGGNLIWNAGNLPLRVEADRLFMKEHEVYTTLNKPTAADVNAVAKSGDTMTGKLFANGNVEIANSAPSLTFTETDSGNKKYILVSDGNGIRLNRNLTSVSNDNLVWRWSDSDVLADCRLELVNPVSRTEQLKVSNALTRYDFVNGELAKKVAKAGDSITGRLTLDYTSSFKVPVGKTNQRGNGVQGDFRFNNDEVVFEGYNGTEWLPFNSGRVKYTTVTASGTVAKGRGHLVDTKIKNIVVTLPGDAVDGDFVIIGDGAGNAHYNPFFVAGFNNDRVKIDRENCVLYFSKVGTKWVITDGVGENGAIRIKDFLPASGGTITGDMFIDPERGHLIYKGKDDGLIARGIEYQNDDGTLNSIYGMSWNGIDKSVDQWFVGHTDTRTWMRVKPSGELYADGNNRIYHQGYKPTAADVKAVDNRDATGDLNLINTDSLARLTGSISNKPSGASGQGDHVLNMIWDTNAGNQLYLPYKVASAMSFRMKDGGTWGNWIKFYHEQNKPTKSDVGLNLVNNWSATSSTTDVSETKYATAKAVSDVNTKADGIIPDVTKLKADMTQVNSDVRTLNNKLKETDDRLTKQIADVDTMAFVYGLIL